MRALKHLYAIAAAGSISLAAPGLHAHSMDDAQNLADMLASALNSRNAGAVTALYRNDAELSQHNAPTLVGRDDIRSYWKSDLAHGNLLTVLTVTSTLDGTDMTLVHGTYRTLDRASGADVGSGHFAQIWRLDGGEWLIDREIWSDHAEMHGDMHHRIDHHLDHHADHHSHE